MVEHRTENSGVGGSIPFIGSMQYFILSMLIKKTTTQLLKTKKNLTIYTLAYAKTISLRNLYLQIINNPVTPVKYTRLTSLLIKTPQYPMLPAHSPLKSKWWYWVLRNESTSTSTYRSMTTRLWFFVYLQLYINCLLGYKFSWYFTDFNQTIKASFFTLWWYKLNSRKLFIASPLVSL